MDVGYERKRRVKVTPRLFTQACARMELPLIGRGKTINQVAAGEPEFRF